MSVTGASQSVFDYLDRKPIQKPNGLLQPHEFQGDIEFNNVLLVYTPRTDEIGIQIC
jgi:ABC-type bacteriocin/lantibiotic exporter with double-glycine peptidase domain